MDQLSGAGQNPEHRNALNCLARATASQGRLRRLKQAQQAWLGSLIRQGSPLAWPAAMRCLATDPECPALHQVATWLAIETGRILEAVELALQLSRLYTARGEPARALDFLRSLRLDYDPKMMLAMAELQLTVGRPHVAAALFRRAGETWERWGNLAPAREAYSRVVAIFPEQAPIWTRLGYLHLRMAEFSPAGLAFRRALELRPECSEALEGLGETCLQTGRREQALLAYRRCFSLHPENRRVTERVAEVLTELGRGEAWESWILAACAWAREGRHQEAARCARHALELDPGNCVARQLAA